MSAAGTGTVTPLVMKIFEQRLVKGATGANFADSVGIDVSWYGGPC